MQELTYSLQITAQSAIQTAAICYRQSVKDSLKLYRIARPIVLYTLATIYVLGQYSYRAGGQFRNWCDRLVEESLEQPSAEPIVTPEPDVIPVAAEPLEHLPIKELRSKAIALGLKIRTQNRRLNKGELIAILS